MRRVFVNKSYDKDEGFRKYTSEKLKELFHVGANTNDLLIATYGDYDTWKIHHNSLSGASSIQNTLSASDIE